MDIQAEKKELIRLITEVNSESVIKKIKNLLQPKRTSLLPEHSKGLKKDKTEILLVQELPAMADLSFAEVWDNEEDEKWTAYLRNKVTHVKPR